MCPTILKVFFAKGSQNSLLKVLLEDTESAFGGRFAEKDVSGEQEDVSAGNRLA